MNYQRLFYIPVILLALHCASETNFKELYLGEEPPESKPKVFGKGIISTEENIELGITISPDGKEILFTRRPKGTNQNRNYYMKFSDGRWTSPQLAPFSYGRRASEPNFSPDGDKIFFNSRRPLPPDLATGFQMNVWVVRKVNDQWGEPEVLRPPVSDIKPMFITEARSGTIYTTGNVQRGIYKSEFKNGMYEMPVRLPDEINSQYWAGHPYIAPDESYIIFDSNMDNKGNKNLFISFNPGDGKWSKAQNISKFFGFPRHSWCPFVTFDGRYFFFCANGDIYWVDSKILLDLKSI